MAAFCIIVGLLGYGVAAVTFLGTTWEQEIGGILISINATLFFLAGLFAARFAPALPAKTE